MAVIVLAACQGGAFAQTSQEKWKAFYAQVERFREQAQGAFDREMVREKAGDCQKADNTRAIGECLEKEIETTTANYKAYTGALRSLLGIMGADPDDKFWGPTGKPLTSKELVNEFDAAEAAWLKYREAMCTAAFDQFKGGTIVALEAGFCELMLVRSHMREIEKIYNVRLHN
jgi:uncharacterized protein YecT (DUF1311 family)